MFSQGQNSNQSLLWKIDGKGLEKPSYIYGTIHLACPEDIVITPAMLEIFSRQHALYLEMDLDDPSVLGGALKEMTMSGDTTLQSLLGDSDYEQVSIQFEAITRLPLALFNKAMPLMTMSAVYPSMLDCQNGKSWEMEFVNLAKQKHIPVYGLESLQEQLDVFESVGYEEQAQMLKVALSNTDSLRTEFTQLMELYKKRDVEALCTMIRSSETMGSMEDALLNIRNKNWIPRLHDIMHKQPSFVAVGAGHLGGSMGILHLLKQEGYTVLPVAY